MGRHGQINGCGLRLPRLISIIVLLLASLFTNKVAMDLRLRTHQSSPSSSFHSASFHVKFTLKLVHPWRLVFPVQLRDIYINWHD